MKKKYCLTVGHFDSDDSFVVDDLFGEHQLHGAMSAAVDAGYCLLDVSISDYD